MNFRHCAPARLPSGALPKLTSLRAFPDLAVSRDARASTSWDEEPLGEHVPLSQHHGAREKRRANSEGSEAACMAHGYMYCGDRIARHLFLIFTCSRVTCMIA